MTPGARMLRAMQRRQAAQRAQRAERRVLVSLTPEDLEALIESSRYGVSRDLTRYLESHRPRPVTGPDPRD